MIDYTVWPELAWRVLWQYEGYQRFAVFEVLYRASRIHDHPEAYNRIVVHVDLRSDFSLDNMSVFEENEIVQIFQERIIEDITDILIQERRNKIWRIP